MWQRNRNSIGVQRRLHWGSHIWDLNKNRCFPKEEGRSVWGSERRVSWEISTSKNWKEASVALCWEQSVWHKTKERRPKANDKNCRSKEPRVRILILTLRAVKSHWTVLGENAIIVFEFRRPYSGYPTEKGYSRIRRYVHSAVKGSRGAWSWGG